MMPWSQVQLLLKFFEKLSNFIPISGLQKDTFCKSVTVERRIYCRIWEAIDGRFGIKNWPGTVYFCSNLFIALLKVLESVLIEQRLVPRCG